MQTIQADEAGTRFLEIPDEVEEGKSLLIAREGIPTARISPEPRRAKLSPHEAFAVIEEIRTRTLPVSLDEVLAARNHGRR